MRLTVDEPTDLAGCFIEIDETKWSQAMLKQAYQSDPQWAELWRRKVTACHLLTPEGEAVTDPAVIPDRIDDLDIRLYNFTLRALRTACDYLATLGEVNKRVSFGAGALAKTTMTTAPNSTTSTTTSGGGA